MSSQRAERVGDQPVARPAGRPSFSALLTDRDRAALERLGRRTSFPAGTVLMHEGLHGEGVFVLLTGVVKATSVTRSGREVVLGFRGRGELLGDFAMIDERPHSSTVVAVEPVEALLVPSRDFRAFVDQTPAAAVALTLMVVARFRETDRRLVEFSASDTLGRVASRLLELAETYGEPSDRGVTITLHLSQEELAGWAGCSVKAVVNALGVLRRLELIETSRRRITIVDLDGIRAQAVAC